jgi:hypothetical protein
MRPETRNRLFLLAKLTVTLALLAVSLCWVRFETLTDRLRNADASWLAVSALLLIAGGFAGAGSWFCIVRAGLPAITYRTAAACHWSGMFFNSFLPSNVGGDVVKGYLVARGRGHTGFVVLSLLIDRAVNLGMLLVIGLFAWLLLTGRLGGAATLAAACVLLLALAPALARLVRAHLSRRPHTPFGRKAAELAEPILALAARPHRFFPTVLAAFASQLLKTGSHTFLVLALGLDVPSLCLWTVIPLFGIVSALPVSIGGLGLRELVAQGVSGPLHVDNTHLVALSLAGHLMVVLVNTLGAVPFLFARRKKG